MEILKLIKFLRGESFLCFLNYCKQWNWFDFRLKLMTNFEKRNLKGFQVFNYGPGYYDDFGKQSEVS